MKFLFVGILWSSLLFTQSITTGEIPEDWRNANISQKEIDTSRLTIDQFLSHVCAVSYWSTSSATMWGSTWISTICWRPYSTALGEDTPARHNYSSPSTTWCHCSTINSRWMWPSSTSARHSILCLMTSSWTSWNTTGLTATYISG